MNFKHLGRAAWGPWDCGVPAAARVWGREEHPQNGAGASFDPIDDSKPYSVSLTGIYRSELVVWENPPCESRCYRVIVAGFPIESAIHSEYSSISYKCL